MMLTGVLFVLFLGGCWLYCLTDAVLTPAVAYRGLSKAAWVSIIATTFVFGALAWLTARSRRQPLLAYADAMHWSAAEASLARHPAGRYRRADAPAAVKGPDDDPDFLRHLDHIIRPNPGGNPPASPQFLQPGSTRVSYSRAPRASARLSQVTHPPAQPPGL